MKVQALIGTQKGAFLISSDEKRSRWQIDGPLFKGWKVTAAHRTADGDYLVATASDVYGPALQRSRDLADWQQVKDGPSYPDGGERKLRQIWRIESAHGRVIAGVDEAGLFQSLDGGASWKPVEALNEHPTRSGWFPGAGGLCAHAILFDPHNPDRMWCGISAVGVFRTDDGGATWNPKNRGVRVVIEDEKAKDIGFCVHALAQDPNDANLIYRQDHAGMYRSRDGGDTWENNETGLPSGFGFPIAIDPHSRALFASPLESDEYRVLPDGALRVFRSRDGGDSWQGLTAGLPQQNCWSGILRGALTVDGLDPCGVYFGTTAGAVYVSNDAGDTFHQLPCTLPRVLCVTVFGGN